MKLIVCAFSESDARTKIDDYNEFRLFEYGEKPGKDKGVLNSVSAKRTRYMQEQSKLLCMRIEAHPTFYRKFFVMRIQVQPSTTTSCEVWKGFSGIFKFFCDVFSDILEVDWGARRSGWK